MEIIAPLVNFEARLLADYNINAIKTLCSLLDIQTQTLRSSDFPTSGKATERLISICRAVGADAYMCGGGSAGYQDDAAFSDAGIQLVPQKFKPPDYGSLPGCSIVDYLMFKGRTGPAQSV